jgi:hypothetical protein
MCSNTYIVHLFVFRFHWVRRTLVFYLSQTLCIVVTGCDWISFCKMRNEYEKESDLCAFSVVNGGLVLGSAPSSGLG